MPKLKCLEWSNLNRKAQNIKKSKNHANPDSLYCLEVTGNFNDKLACLGSNQLISIYDESNLRLISEAKATVDTNSIGFFKKNKDMMFTSANKGVLTCLDLRDKNKVAIRFDTTSFENRDFLCADVNLGDTLIATGTNKNVDDALLLIYDMRSTQRHLHKLKESHSNDITQIKFNPAHACKFSSASLDGLVCFYDLDLLNQAISEVPKNESSDSESSNSDSDSEETDTDPDIMDQCLNTESCVTKISYVATDPNNSSSDYHLFAITTTNDFFVWELLNYDVVCEHKSTNKSITDVDTLPQDEDYFFDYFYYAKDCPLICRVNKSGEISLWHKDFTAYEQKRAASSEEKKHRDIIRSSFWNSKSMCLITAAEDGYILKWKLIEDDNDDNSSQNQHRKRKNEDIEQKKSLKKHIFNKNDS